MEFREFSAKTIDAALTEATIQLGTTSDQIEFEVIEKGSSGLLGFGSKNALIRAKKKYSPVDDARDFLVDVTAAMGLHVEVKIEMEEKPEFYK